jgi:hypothetical protein
MTRMLYEGCRVILVPGGGTQKEYAVIRSWSTYQGGTLGFPDYIDMKAS